MKNINLRNKSFNSIKNDSFNLTGVQMCFIGLICVIFDVISEKFGTYPQYSSGRYSHMEMLGIIFPLAILIIPFFVKKFRKNLWCKKNIIVSIFVLLISIILIIITYANKDYYWSLWFENGHWERDNCPPIRWDFWNIIGKRA